MVSDTGYASIWTATMLELSNAQQTYLRAAGSLGWAFPAALGAKCAVPDRPVICFTGDGGFWYHLSELETARRHKIKTVTIVNNNHGLAQGIDDIHAQYAGRPGNPGSFIASSRSASLESLRKWAVRGFACSALMRSGLRSVRHWRKTGPRLSKS